MKKIKNSTIGRVLLGVFIAAMIIAIVIMGVKLSRTTSERIGGEVYEIGLLDTDGTEKDGNTSIRMRNGVTTDGLKCTLEKEAKIKYQIFFYDKSGKFLSTSDELTADYDGKSIPEGAKTAKVVITPTADEDGKVSLVEVLGYANQLTVTVNK